MMSTKTSAAHGTAMLIISQGCYFVLGYLAVVWLARELGPAAYGTYSVILSILLWLEESGRNAIPSAAAKYLAEAKTGQAEIERSALVLNLGVHLGFFGLLWIAAPMLAALLSIHAGTSLFRLAALDLPLFGLYTTFQAISQGHRHFGRLSLTQVLYALTKFLGVLVLVQIGVSVEKALLLNVVATVVGLLCLWPGAVWPRSVPWCKQVVPLASVAFPMGLYFLPLMLQTSLILGVLKIMTPASGDASLGVLMAAQNIARVPAFTLMTVTVVLLPALAQALARRDEPLAKHYVHQALRLFLILYIPAAFLLMVAPENLMQWVYSKDFSGGGLMLTLVVIGEGINTLQAIFGSILLASGKMRQAALSTTLALIPALVSLVLLIYLWGTLGAAGARIAMPCFGAFVLGVLITRRFGFPLRLRTVRNLGMAVAVLLTVTVLFPPVEEGYVFRQVFGLAGYGLTLLLSREATWQDVAALLPGKAAASSHDMVT